MSASSNMRQSGFTALLATSGEGLTYGVATSVTALVNRKVVNLRNGLAIRDGQMNFDVMGMTEIEHLRSAIVEPKAGESFKDSLGFRHRIRHVCSTDITWVLYCTQSKA